MILLQIDLKSFKSILGHYQEIHIEIKQATRNFQNSHLPDILKFQVIFFLLFKR